MWGIIPAAGQGSRMQPLAFSKELLPVGSRLDEGTERPCAVSEYLLERMIVGGVRKICFVISPGKSDILEYYGAAYADASIAYVIQPKSAGLCDALFQALPLIGEEEVLIGLPDTVWFPKAGYDLLPAGKVGFLLFPVEKPELFDAVVTAPDGRVLTIQVKSPAATSRHVWGAIKMPGSTFHDLHRLWRARERRDEFLGTLVNAWLEIGGEAYGVAAGTEYVDVGTLNGYRAALLLLERKAEEEDGNGARIGVGWPAGRQLSRGGR